MTVYKSLSCRVRPTDVQKCPSDRRASQRQDYVSPSPQSTILGFKGTVGTILTTVMSVLFDNSMTFCEVIISSIVRARSGAVNLRHYCERVIVVGCK